jgi:hypothetical protein
MEACDGHGVLDLNRQSRWCGWSNIYVQKQIPHYWLEYDFGLGIVLAAIGATFVLRWAYAREKRKRDLVSEDEFWAKFTESELLDIGDKSPLYRYVI